MKKIFYIMRHGQTLFNLRKKIQGHCDSPLTEEGIKQAEAASKYFEGIDLDYVYSSTSERACDTLEIVTKNRMPYTRLKGLKEMNFGMFEGESEELHPPREKFNEFYPLYGGDTFDSVRERMVKTCTEIMENDNHNTVLAVSHAGACINFLSHWQNPEKIIRDGVTNCIIFKYEYENEKFSLIDVIRPVV